MIGVNIIKYSYQDKLFLNKNSVTMDIYILMKWLMPIFKLGYTELLPVVIMSLNASFKKIFKHYSKIQRK